MKTPNRGKLCAIAIVGPLALSALAGQGAYATPSGQPGWVAQDQEGVQLRSGYYSIELSPRIVRAGGRLTVQISGVYMAKSCTVTLRQGKKKSVVKLRVRNFNAKGKLSIPKAFRGQIKAKVACGKDGRSTSQPVAVVGPRESRKATCDVVERGNTEMDGAALTAFRARNSSRSLSTGPLEFALVFSNSAGKVLKTNSIMWYPGLPPNTTAIFATSTYVGSRYTSVRILPRCSTSAEKAPAIVLPSQGVVVSDEDGLRVRGTFRNTSGRTIDRYTNVAYLLRSPSGAILGGGEAYTDAFVPPGGVGSWEEYDWADPYRGRAVRVEASVLVETP